MKRSLLLFIVIFPILHGLLYCGGNGPALNQTLTIPDNIITPDPVGLHIVSPNGGETYAPGGNLDIIWEGTDLLDTVSIEYSSNNGKSWLLITDSASGLKFTWKNNPLVQGDQYLLRIRLSKDTLMSSVEHTLPEDMIVVFKWSCSGETMLTSSNGHETETASLWDIESERKLFNSKLSDSSFHEIFMNSNDSLIATLADEWYVKVWQAKNGEFITNLGADDYPEHIQWSPDGSELAVGFDQGIRVFNADNWKLRFDKHFNNNYFYNHFFIWSRDSKKIIILGPDTVNIIDALHGNIIRQIPCSISDWRLLWYIDISWNPEGDHHYMNRLESLYSPDGNKLAMPCKDLTYRIIDINTGATLYSIPSYKDRNTKFAWSPDSKKIIIYNKDRMELRSGINGEFLCTYPDMKNIYSFSWCPDGHRIATVDEYASDSIQIWNIDNGQPLQEIRLPDIKTMLYRWGPDGRRMAAFCSDGMIRIWNLGNLYEQEDVSDNNWAIVKPLISSKDIDLGKSLVGKTLSVTVGDFIANPGIVNNYIRSIYFEGEDKEQFAAELTGSPLVEPGGQLPVNFYFTPGSLGSKNALVVIISLADTIKQVVKGQGVQPEISLLNNFIDFGTVKVGSSKDSLALLLHNRSLQEVKIDSVKLAGPDAGHFSIPYTSYFTLDGNEQKKLLLRFIPQATGQFSCTLNFYFNGPGSPAQTVLTGTGFLSPPEIEAGTIVFSDLKCNSETRSTINVTNNGQDDLIITDAAVTGKNSGDFSLESTNTPITLKLHETITIGIMYRPASPGTSTAALELKSNSSTDSILVIPLIGVKDSVALVPAASSIDLGVLCPGETKDSSLRISNMGTAVTGGYAVGGGVISIPEAAFSIEQSGTMDLPFHFAGLTDEGRFTYTITVFDSVCGYSRAVDVTGNVIMPRFRIDNLVFLTRLGKPQEKTTRIANTGDRDILIENPPVLSAPFELIEGSFPMAVPAGESRQISVRYTPLDTNEVQAAISLSAEPCGAVAGSSLSGSGFVARAVLKAGTFEGYPGDIVELPVYLAAAENTDKTEAASVSTDISFNSTLLVPLSHPLSRTENGISTVSFSGLSLRATAGEEIARIEFMVGLGNAAESPVTFSNCRSDGDDITIDTISGKFTLLGICKEGGARLVNTNGSAALLSVTPNPAEDVLQITLNLTEAGENNLTISNLSGSTVKQILRGPAARYGMNSLSADISSLAAGTYVLTLSTPTETSSLLFIKYR